LVVAEGRGSAQGEVRTAEGEVTLAGLASLTDGFDDVTATAELNLPDLGAFVGRSAPGAEARGCIGIAWTSRDGLETSVDLQGRFEEASVDTLLFRGRLGRSSFDVDTLLLRSEIAGADGGGRLALQGRPEGTSASDLSLTFDIRNLSPLGPLLGIDNLELRSGTGSAHVTGPSDAPSLSARLALGPWSVRGVSGDSASMGLTYRPEEVTLDLWLQEPEEQGFIDVALRADPRPEERHGTLERLEASGPGARWALEAPVPFSWIDGFRIDRLSLVSEEGRISLDGSVNPRGDQDLRLEVEEASLSALTTLLRLEELMLVADGELHLTGPAASPVADGEFRFDTGVRGGPSSTVDARFRLSDGSLTLNVLASDTAGGRAILEGTVPLAFSLAPAPSSGEAGVSDLPTSEEGAAVDLRLRGEDFDVSWARALVPHGAIEALAGTLSADLRAGGTFGEPTLEGSIGLSDGLLRVTASRTRYQDIGFAAVLQNDGIRILRAHAASGDGSAEVEGFISVRAFKPEELEISATMDRFSAWSSPTVAATLTGGIDIRGSIEEPLIEGDLNFEGSKVNLDGVSSGNEVRAVELTEADYEMLKDYFGYEPERVEVEPSNLLERFGLNLTVQFDRDVWVNRSRQPRVALEARGNLEVQKEPGEPLRVFGTVETLSDRSYFRQFGRRFSVEEGQLSLAGDPAAFSFRLEAQWEVPDHANPDEAAVVINLRVEGDAEALELTLSSEPEMDEADIVSYLATGKPQNALGSSDQGEMAGLGTSMAMGAMAGVLEGLASDAVELDVVEVQVDPVKGATLIAGRYVNPDLYLGFRQPVTLSEDKRRRQTLDSEVELEYRWFHWLTMNIQGGASELRFFLKTRYAY
jgi:translocation and assembly module TamB